MKQIKLSFAFVSIVVFGNIFLQVYGYVKKPLKPTVKTTEDAMRHLEQFGYMEKEDMINNIESTKMQNVITTYQRFMGLPETGKLDDKTMEMMNTPRCGVPDFDPKKDMHDGKLRSKRYTIQGSSWPKTDLTWKVIGYSEVDTLKSKEQQIDEVFKKSFEVWQKSSTLRFFHSPKEKKVDIEIKFVKGRHGDRSPFDGPGNTLAHAFYPEFGGSAHFDDTEDWTFGDEGTDLMSVAVHEFGHSLGLRHSDVEGSVMYPAYQGTRNNLTNDDIQGINMIYPPKPGKNEEDLKPKKRPLTISTESQSPGPGCKKFKLDAATCVKEGYCFFFSGNNLWYIPDKSTSVSRNAIQMSKVFRRLSGPVDAAVTDNDGRTYIFKGNGVWIYTKSFSDPVAENRPISEVFPGLNTTRIDAAFRWSKNGKMYFFKDTIYWRYEGSKHPPIEHGYPKSVVKWRGLPNQSFDAIFQWAQNRKTYFFKDDSYWRYNDELFNVDPFPKAPFPRSTSKWWMGCGNSTATARFGRTFAKTQYPTRRGRSFRRL